jgi:hypothetical protein
MFLPSYAMISRKYHSLPVNGFENTAPALGHVDRQAHTTVGIYPQPLHEAELRELWGHISRRCLELFIDSEIRPYMDAMIVRTQVSRCSFAQGYVGVPQVQAVFIAALALVALSSLLLNEQGGVETELFALVEMEGICGTKDGLVEERASIILL